MIKYIVIVAIVVVALGAYTLRDTLKTYFETGDVPTQEQFKDTIDSALNLTDDGLSAKEYVPGDTVVKSEPVYQAKILTEAQGQLEFSLSAPEPVTFRWTALVPKPQESTTYRIKVWQLMQGQNGTQAMKANQPVVTKDVTDVTEVTVSSLYTGPCKPPYLCDFVWSVEALSTASTGTGGGTDPSTGAR